MTRFILFYFTALCFIDKLSYSNTSYYHLTGRLYHIAAKHDESNVNNEIGAIFNTCNKSKTGSVIGRKTLNEAKVRLIKISVVLAPSYAQSPINIVHKIATKVIYPPVKFYDLCLEEKFLIANTGHTYKLRGLSKKAILTGGPLCNEYSFNNLHFHWGKVDGEGSEHQIDGEKFPLEAHFLWNHFIDYNVPAEVLKESKARYFKMLCAKRNKEQLFSNKTSHYEIMDFIERELDDLYYWPVPIRRDGKVESETIARTLKITTFDAIYQYLKWIQVNEGTDPCDYLFNEEKYDSIICQFTPKPTIVSAVIAVFFRINDSAFPYDALSFVNNVTKANSNFTIIQELLSQILNLLNFNQYYAYSGSATTPPFPTSVTWIVLRQPIFISHKQLEPLRMLLGVEGIIKENWRKEQHLAGRIVYFHDKKTEIEERNCMNIN